MIITDLNEILDRKLKGEHKRSPFNSVD
ncbi:hypothetical protein AND4_13728 [Vibrio sp. AND4]|nr:hypothetical protein AND4_13728 [Vibrio sp. AND4]